MAAKIRLLTCVGVEFEAVLFAHFLDHYLALGIEPGHIHALIHAGSAEACGLDEARRIAASYGIPEPQTWIAPYTSADMWEERRKLQAAVCGPDDWVMNADVDEHHVYPAPPQDILRHCTASRVNVVQGVMIDRLAPGGALNPVMAKPALNAQFPLDADLAIALFGRVRGKGLGGTFKVMLHRAEVFPRRGGHDVSQEGVTPRYLTGDRLAATPGFADQAVRFAFPFRVNHYKWTQSRLPKIARRIATPGASSMGQHFGTITTDYIAEHGRIRLQDVALDTPARDFRGVRWRTLARMHRLRARLRRFSGFLSGIGRRDG